MFFFYILTLLNNNLLFNCIIIILFFLEHFILTMITEDSKINRLCTYWSVYN